MMDCAPYIVTYAGEEFNPVDPNVLKIHIRDIAHALSNQCRFAGHCREFYSVAQHSLLVLYLYQEEVEKPTPEIALWALLHDAAEAYLVDLPRPIKKNTVLGTEYDIMESRLQECIAARFLLPHPIPEIVQTCDELAARIEAQHLMKANRCFDPIPTRFGAWSRVPKELELARSRFLWEFGQWSHRHHFPAAVPLDGD